MSWNDYDLERVDLYAYNGNGKLVSGQFDRQGNPIGEPPVSAAVLAGRLDVLESGLNYLAWGNDFPAEKIAVALQNVDVRDMLAEADFDPVGVVKMVQGAAKLRLTAAASETLRGKLEALR